MAYGLDATGFTKKPLAIIKAELETDFRAALGVGVDLGPLTVLGQIIGINAEREALIWDLMEAVWNSSYPDTASDVSLDNAVALTGLSRRPATFSTVTLRIFGVLGTVVPLTPTPFTASVSGNPTAKFAVIAPGTVHAGINAIQKIGFSATPTAGAFALNFGGQITASIAYNDSLATIKSRIEALSNITSVTVTGTVSTSGLFIEFTGVDGEKPWALPTVATNTLASPSATITPTYSAVGAQLGYTPHVDVAARATATGATQGLAGTITTIDTATFNITSVTNLLDASVGTARETDAELKARRLDELQRTGTATVEGIRNELLTVLDVRQALIVENTTLTTDGGGRPAKSFESFVQGGDQDAIAAAIFASKPAGIETYGTITRPLVDSQGFSQSVKFSRPTEKQVYLIVNITKNTNALNGPVYPSNGDTLVEDALLDFTAGFTIGQDVINSQLYTPVNTVPGVIGIDIKQGFSAVPTLTANLTIAATELATFDSARITVNS